MIRPRTKNWRRKVSPFPARHHIWTKPSVVVEVHSVFRWETVRDPVYVWQLQHEVWRPIHAAYRCPKPVLVLIHRNLKPPKDCEGSHSSGSRRSIHRDSPHNATNLAGQTSSRRHSQYIHVPSLKSIRETDKMMEMVMVTAVPQVKVKRMGMEMDVGMEIGNTAEMIKVWTNLCTRRRRQRTIQSRKAVSWLQHHHQMGLHRGGRHLEGT